LVGPDALGWYAAPNAWRKLTTRKLNKDLNLLKDFPPDHTWEEIEYNQNGGVVEDYYLFFCGTDFSSKYDAESTNLLRMEFPPNIIQQIGLDTFLNFVVRIANRIPFQSGNIGYGFKRNTATEDAAEERINQLLPRYYGFDPCDSNLRYSMRDHTLMAHWINLINNELAEKLGGYDAFCKAIPDAHIQKLDQGIFIRGAKMPPVGDINRRAPDIGCLPDVARLLKPTRVVLNSYFPFDTEAWLGRFDKMKNRDWEQKS
jgi:hypothetical protein